MTKPVIRKGIPIPPQRKRIQTGLVQVLREMEVGDMIEVPISDWKNENSAGSSIWQLSKRAGIKTTVRVADGVARIWRVS